VEASPLAVADRALVMAVLESAGGVVDEVVTVGLALGVFDVVLPKG